MINQRHQRRRQTQSNNNPQKTQSGDTIIGAMDIGEDVRVTIQEGEEDDVNNG